MTMTLEQMLAEIDGLPLDTKAILAEHLIARIGEEMAPTIEKEHLMEIKNRRNDIRTGKSIPLEGKNVLAAVRNAVKP